MNQSKLFDPNCIYTNTEKRIPTDFRFKRRATSSRVENDKKKIRYIFNERMKKGKKKRVAVQNTFSTANFERGHEPNEQQREKKRDVEQKQQ